MTNTMHRHEEEAGDRVHQHAAAGPHSHGTRGAARRNAPLGWVPWVSLLAIAVLGLGALLVARNVGDAGDAAGVDLVDEPAAEGQDPPGLDANRNDGADPGGDPDTGSEASNSASGSSGSGTSGSGTASGAAPTGMATSPVNAGGQPVFPLPADQSLAAFEGKAVEGDAARVIAVVSDEGFWVGTDEAQRVFVFLTPQARTSRGESPFQVSEGQTVNFTGTMKPVDDPASFGVTADEGADQLAQQGEYVEVTAVSLA